MTKIILVFTLLALIQPGLDITRDELLGKFDVAQHPDFIKIDSQFTSKTDIYLRRKAYTAFQRMNEAAHEQDIELNIVSATRSFYHQKRIWEGKWQRTRYMGWSDFEKARDIMTYSSMPGTSRHHWGTDIDLVSLNNDYFEQGEGLITYNWLVENGPKFGFGQTYTSKDVGRTGYEEEKWHWSYMPLSQIYLQAYLEMMSSDDIEGFSGHGIADSLSVISHYVNGIDSTLLNY